MPDFFEDESLMRQLRLGRLSQAGPLFERHHGSLYGFFVHSTRDPVVSQDLVQEVFLRVISSRTTYQTDRPFKPWMYRIARNVLYDHTRKKTAHSNEALPTSEALPSETLEQAELHESLHRAIAQLPPDQRELLLLSHISDLSYREIARVYDISVNAARVRVFRALKALRSVYKQSNPED